MEFASSKNKIIPFWMAGDPSLEESFQVLRLFLKSGVAALEIGIPYSDPVADGPIVQGATERALRNGVAISDVFQLVRRLRDERFQAPIILFGYLNPILQFGLVDYVREAKAAGASATLCVDLPPEEAEEFVAIHRLLGLGTGFLISPTTSSIRRDKAIAASSDFVYYVARAGVTGSATEIDEALTSGLHSLHKYIQKISSGCPQKLLVGFGVKTGDQVRKLSSSVDGIVVGSALIQKFQQDRSLEALHQMVGELSNF